MPLMPAMRPLKSISRAAERPISAPPRVDATGVKLGALVDASTNLAHGAQREQRDEEADGHAERVHDRELGRVA